MNYEYYGEVEVTIKKKRLAAVTIVETWGLLMIVGPVTTGLLLF